MNDKFQDDVMIVDDTPANLSVLSSILGEAGYRNRPVISGRTALRAIARRAPAVILLDVRMPELDGYAVCRALKADPATREIPVVFISAADDPADRLAAFQAGGVDYLVKPFQAEEVVARVATQMTLVRQGRVLAALRERLEDIRALRESVDRVLEELGSLEGDSPAQAERLARVREDAGVLRERVSGLLDVDALALPAQPVGLEP